MRIYLIVYFALCLGAGLVLWQTGALDSIPGSWLAAVTIVVVCLGILLAAVSMPRTVSGDNTPES